MSRNMMGSSGLRARLTRCGQWVVVAFGFLAPSVHAQNDALQDGDREMATLGGDKSQPSQFIARCPPGQQVAGFDLGVGDPTVAGDGIFSIQPLCFTALAPAVAGALEPYRSKLGDGGKRSLRTTCPSDTPVVTMMKVEGEKETGVAWGDLYAYSVNGIGLYCGLVDKQTRPPVAGPSYWGRLRYQEAGGLGAGLQALADEKSGERTGTIWGNSRCADGLVAVGISGQFRERLYALGLICGEPRLTQGPAVRAVGRVKLPGSEPSGPPRPICDVAREARARNSPAAPGLEAQCNATQSVEIQLDPGLALPDPDALAVRGAVLANEDPLAMELRDQQSDDAARRGFHIGMAAAEGQTGPGPGKDRIRDSLPPEERQGFIAAVAFTLERNKYAQRAAIGATIAAADPIVAEARNTETDVFYRLGFDIATGIFGDPALGAQGNTAPGPGSMGIRDALSAAARQGFNASMALHLSRNYAH